MLRQNTQLKPFGATKNAVFVIIIVAQDRFLYNVAFIHTWDAENWCRRPIPPRCSKWGKTFFFIAFEMMGFQNQLRLSVPEIV